MNEGETLLQFTTWFIFLMSYLMGSIPFGFLFTRLAKLGDVRTIGSGNIGATNVLRTGNKKVAALTLLCDMLKGTVIILIIKFLSAPTENSIIVSLAGFFAFLGHLFPIWLKFKGGKGVATYLGVCLGVYWPAAIVFIVVWMAIFLLTRYSSLSALVAVVITAIFVFYFCNPYFFFILIVMSMFVYIKHYANIGRLLVGKESKIGTQNGDK
ncbi:glycerol-3-phosphate 1-O-acyltransferase PlsY [Bartonella taylorii]|uniref:Glycerol-3-phosphate acyltransferase n=2 Tax=Bartonella taylorii TaxID=33046 RepID=A0A9Q8YZJ4_BARTA|nr:glycerol-3-phosphate 1-O-acyltransferase PlsY [Bartonella taylorii]EJF94108.1 glycerol-3-phosphate acyltransferase [Bartonella taylorii 8TBB]OPB35522.1 acyl-phosphate glycerol-3-phosphate acyltransferase [Bartonella taylorii]USP01853.1 glycerol-3-phosphate 1-O-acyltransferase PlsY [Bartonella taylorii]USP03150.1 glycerol-3-phosphate 1-O-acyltransferase PlsY [Bartonella taylorii]